MSYWDWSTPTEALIPLTESCRGYLHIFWTGVNRKPSNEMSCKFLSSLQLCSNRISRSAISTHTTDKLTSKKKQYCSFSCRQLISLTAWGWLLQYWEYTLNSCCYGDNRNNRESTSQRLSVTNSTHIENKHFTNLTHRYVTGFNSRLQFTKKVLLKIIDLAYVWEYNLYLLLIEQSAVIQAPLQISLRGWREGGCTTR